MAGLHAIYNSSLFDLDVDMDSLKAKVNSIEPVVGKLNEEIKGICGHQENLQAVIIQTLILRNKTGRLNFIF